MAVPDIKVWIEPLAYNDLHSESSTLNLNLIFGMPRPDVYPGVHFHA